MSMDKRRRHSLEVEDELRELGEDEDAYIEAERERRQERFKSDVDRHIFGRGGKLKIAIAKTKLALIRKEDYNPIRDKIPELRFNRQNSKAPLINKVPFGKENRTRKEQYLDRTTIRHLDTGGKFSDINPDGKIRPPKPTQRDRARIIQAKIKQASALDTEKFLNDNFQKSDRMTGHGLFIHPNGDMIKPRDDLIETHYDAVRYLGKQIGLKQRPGISGNALIDDDDIHSFLQKTNTVRLNNSLGVAHAHIAAPLTSAQLKTLREYEMEFGDLEYGIGKTLDDATFNVGFRTLTRDHARIFGQKKAQEEDTNVNMTYTKSKKVKLLKEMFRDQRTAKSSESISLFKQQVLGPEHEEGFGFDPRHGDFVTPQSARERYGKPGVALHFIATTDNPGPVENISKALDMIGENHFIGGWKSSTGFKTDASYIINTNDTNEVIDHLKRHNQEASYSVDPSGNTYFIRNPHFKKH
jgi:hypothetical protein